MFVSRNLVERLVTCLFVNVLCTFILYSIGVDAQSGLSGNLKLISVVANTKPEVALSRHPNGKYRLAFVFT
jgi:hypothetical protein